MGERKGRKAYERPAIVKQAKMGFPLRGVEAAGKGPACRQCSSCHRDKPGEQSPLGGRGNR